MSDDALKRLEAWLRSTERRQVVCIGYYDCEDDEGDFGIGVRRYSDPEKLDSFTYFCDCGPDLSTAIHAALDQAEEAGL